jgi:hypothetical protein
MTDSVARPDPIIAITTLRVHASIPLSTRRRGRSLLRFRTADLRSVRCWTRCDRAHEAAMRRPPIGGFLIATDRSHCDLAGSRFEKRLHAFVHAAAAIALERLPERTLAPFGRQREQRH